MSFRVSIAPNRRAAARYIGKVRRRLQKALVDSPEIKRTQIADAIGVHRSVITRQLQGSQDMSLGRVAEIAWALGFEPTFDLRRRSRSNGDNKPEAERPAHSVSTNVKILEPESTSGSFILSPASPAFEDA